MERESMIRTLLIAQRDEIDELAKYMLWRLSNRYEQEFEQKSAEAILGRALWHYFSRRKKGKL